MEASAPTPDKKGVDLAPLLRADFFLTDGRGIVTRWGSRPARAFAREAEDVVGRPAFEVVVTGAGKWKRHLAGEGDRPGSRVSAKAVEGDFEVELLVLPVPLSQSLEMSRLLEGLGPDSPPKQQLEHDHAEALNVLRDPPSSGDLAGLVVAYTAPERPGLPTPAVGEPEERLSRVGELEREVKELAERADSALALAEQALALVEHRSAPSQPPAAPAAPATGQPQATIALDGRFESINPAFESLVGYSEADFRHARWPSLTDREKLSAHRALLAQLATGELESARVETVYMHGQGLTVPVNGMLELMRADDGSPGHLRLSVDHEVTDGPAAEPLASLGDDPVLEPVAAALGVSDEHDLVGSEGGEGVLEG